MFIRHVFIKLHENCYTNWLEMAVTDESRNPGECFASRRVYSFTQIRRRPLARISSRSTRGQVSLSKIESPVVVLFAFEFLGHAPGRTRVRDALSTHYSRICIRECKQETAAIKLVRCVCSVRVSLTDIQSLTLVFKPSLHD